MELVKNLGHALAIWCACYVLVHVVRGIAHGWRKARAAPIEPAYDSPNVEMRRRFWDGR